MKINCLVCQSSFTPKERYAVTCSEECKRTYDADSDAITQKQLQKVCIHCEKPFRLTTHTSKKRVCDRCAKSYSRAKCAKTDYRESFLNRKDKKGQDLTELIKKQEYKRLYGKGEWERHCSNPKGDKI